MQALSASSTGLEDIRPISAAESKVLVSAPTTPCSKRMPTSRCWEIHGHQPPNLSAKQRAPRRQRHEGELFKWMPTAPVRSTMAGASQQTVWTDGPAIKDRYHTSRIAIKPAGAILAAGSTSTLRFRIQSFPCRN